MNRQFPVLIVIFILSLATAGTVLANGASMEVILKNRQQDTIYNRQLLYNGRAWENRYQKILSHEFFLTRNQVNGSVTINGMTFENNLLRYDVFNDELLILFSPDTWLQLNKEAISGFTLLIDNKRYLFENFERKNLKSTIGYSQVIYHGEIYLIKKYSKEIKKYAVDNKYDSFTEAESVYMVMGGENFRLGTRKDIFNALSDRKEEIKRFVKTRGLKISLKNPESLIPVLEFYDSLNQ
ncbi:MAG: hypothetical protein E4G92_04725 [Bacteroidia bacterium]|nr:MAG: hypothetical protein E4G92_04725 [Bacteroidia bacterium]